MQDREDNGKNNRNIEDEIVVKVGIFVSVWLKWSSPIKKMKEEKNRLQRESEQTPTEDYWKSSEM